MLDEAGSLCGLGHDGAAHRGYFAEGSQAFGHEVPSGAGNGEPFERDANTVRDDVLDGYYDAPTAEDVYGVVLRDDLSIDTDATTARRCQVAAQSGVRNLRGRIRDRARASSRTSHHSRGRRSGLHRSLSAGMLMISAVLDPSRVYPASFRN
ncbi:MAG: hypothetical protein J2P17_13170 [Mycobacterium sp.]|nr:hypothetical protein [Mycobacterium sp.]